MPKIKVHEKALAHLSRGLYRSPASALRELVSNAWDANAATVTINTNYPNFYQLSIEDDGDGFSKSDFEQLMEGGIGNSQKRPSELTLINDRPVIGRFGIGMLGIAQMCGAFVITSKPKDKSPGFRARIQLFDRLKERLDAEDPEVVATPEARDAAYPEEIYAGNYEFEQYDAGSVRCGTRILADDLHPTFIKTFQVSLENSKRVPTSWSKAIDIISSKRSLQELGDYWRLLWELAAACPLPYLSANVLPDNLITQDHKRLKKYGFNVVIDNIELAKPVRLQNNPGGYTSHLIEEQRQTIYGRDLVFHGYIVVQEGLNLRPDEFRGIMIRIKDVAVGYYDTSMLDYRINEGPRSRWLTGEVYVSEGLEDALNIDRDSFNKFHPQYKALQSYVHNILQKKIFPDVYKQIEVRSGARAESKEQAHSKHLQQVLKTHVGSPVNLKQSAASEDEPTVEVTETAKGITLNLPPQESLKTKKNQRPLARAILAVFEMALRESGRERQRTRFRELLLDLLDKW
ncbi:MAG TPA: ATP-binding protein [Bryobacteraceae bacterium]|nr:ATP-binding protein [Bryobacteraceae bacterium]